MPDWSDMMGAPRADETEPAYAPPFRPLPEQTSEEPPIEEGPPNPASLGGEIQRDKAADRIAAGQLPTTEAGTSELRARASEHLARPDRVQVSYHIVLTEERGNADWRGRTLAVGAAQAVGVLGLDQNRRRAVITLISSTADGEYVALGREGELAPTEYSPGNGVPPPNAYLLSTSQPTIEVKHVREVYAIFVPDPTKPSVGQTAYLSIAIEAGDPSLAHDRPTSEPSA